MSTTLIIVVGWVIAFVCAAIYTDYEYDDVSKQLQHERNLGPVWMSAIACGFFVGYLWILGIIVILISQKIKQKINK